MRANSAYMIGRFKRSPAGTVEDDAFRIEQLAARRRCPRIASSHRTGTYLSLAGVIAQRVGETALLLKRVIAPRFELRHRVFGKEVRPATAVR